MHDLSGHNPHERFTGLAGLYARHRPDYPADALDFIVARCGLGPDTLLVDVGCGTGISSRLFARRGIRVLGVEPNDEMRQEAATTPVSSGLAPRYLKGTAEATGLADGCATAVLAAQAFHWFDAPRALAEFHRILRPGGHVALIWNERDETDPFTAAYGAVVRSSAEAAVLEKVRSSAGEPLLSSELFEAGERVPFRHTQQLDEDGVLGRAFSVSYAPKEPAAATAFAEALRLVFRTFQCSGTVTMRYETTVFVARRA